MHRFTGLIAALFFVMTAATATAQTDDNTLYLYLAQGRVEIELRPDIAPKHVARIKQLTREKFYDGLLFHRVIEGFMAQTGDPEGTGFGGSGMRLPAEFSSEPFRRGTVGMARGPHPNSGDSQFFITYARARHLDSKYTVWGQVVDGMDLVDNIRKGEPPAKPDRITRMRLASDPEK